MKLLLVTFDPPENVGGVEGRANGYVKELRRRGHFVVLEGLAPGYSLELDPSGDEVAVRQPSDAKSFPNVLRNTIRLCDEKSIDSVFMLSGALTLFGIAMLTYCKATRRRSTVLFYGKDILQARRTNLGKLLLTLSQRLADRIVVNSRYTSSLLPRRVLAKTSILYPSVDTTLSRRGTNTSTRGSFPTVLFVGRLVKRKGMADLIDAFRLVLNMRPTAQLEIVGDGPEKSYLERIVADLGLAKNVTFYGTLRGDELSERYVNCDVFAMTPRTLPDDVEGFGTVFLEAGLFGKASVGTVSGGVPEAVIDGKTGILALQGDVTGIARALTTLLSDGGLRNELGKNARTRVTSQFTFERGVDQLLRVLAS
ncbi:MAG TPA: glycosyltransferase family 4 protein [Nitrososphaerales archaeon]|nr:glycosyltransferase family 4 protein [Nitrososphaerales archaeon]